MLFLQSQHTPFILLICRKYTNVLSDPKVSDRFSRENNADTDQTDLGFQLQFILYFPVQKFSILTFRVITANEPRHEKPKVLHMRKQKADQLRGNREVVLHVNEVLSPSSYTLIGKYV